MNTRSMIVGMCGIPLLTVQLSLAQTKRYFNPEATSAYWDEDFWGTSCSVQGSGGEPLSTEAAVICPGKDCTVRTDEEVVYVEVANTGILRINSTKTLKLNGDLSTSDIDGIIYITGTLAIDWLDPQAAIHAFTGAGQINGTATGAMLTIEGYCDLAGISTLVNSTTISGILQIKESNSNDAKLKLDSGTIHANGNGDLKIELAMMQDAGTSHFKVSSNTNARLYLELPGSCHAGDCVFPCFEYTDVEVLRGTFSFKHRFVTEKMYSEGEGGRTIVNDPVDGVFDAPTDACTQ